MMRGPKVRPTTSLPDSLHRKLEMYGLAAAATGLSIAALASPAAAEVVFTPAHHEIGRNGVIIDFNHDGIADVEIAANRNFFADGRGMVAYSHESNRAFGTARGEFVSMLPFGYTVGPNSAKFKLGNASSNYPKPKKFFYYCEANSGGASCAGPWYQTGGTSGSYVGFKFQIDGQVHYGWARIKLEVTGRNFQAAVYLTGYAYETIADKPIVTGATGGSDKSSAKGAEPDVNKAAATLGMLSAGAPALGMWH